MPPGWATTVQFSFADHTLDTDKRELRRGSEPIAVEPQVFDLLIYLVEHRDRVVSKDDLIASVWGGRIVSESTLASRINAARKAIGDNGDEQKLIRTFSRKGVRFVADVRASAEDGAPTQSAGAPPDEPREVGHRALRGGAQAQAIGHVPDSHAPLLLLGVADNLALGFIGFEGLNPQTGKGGIDVVGESVSKSQGGSFR